MPPSEPLHGVPALLSEKTRAVVNCIVTRMMQLMEKLLATPDRAPAGKDELDALLRQETASAISECGLLPSHTNSRNPRLCPLNQRTTITSMEGDADGVTHSGQPAGPPTLKILQWNVQGLRPKKHELLQTVFEEHLDVVLLF